MVRGVVKLRTLVLCLSMMLGVRRAAAQCAQGDAALSEARAARWLLRDEANASAVLDNERLRRLPPAQLPALHALAFIGISGNGSRLPVCTNSSVLPGELQRNRGWGGVGLTHYPSGLHVRFSFMFGQDSLSVDLPNSKKKNPPSASAGYRQKVFVVRFGHERWFHGVLGFIEAESRFNRPLPELGVSTPLTADTSIAGVSVGATVPVLHLGFHTLIRSGTLEVLSLGSPDVRLGRLPIAIGFSPTYIAEERRAIGTARVHLFSAPDPMNSYDSETSEISAGSQSSGATLEASVEARDARFRHGRFRYGSSVAFASEQWDRQVEAAGYVEGTVFRSAFFSNGINRDTAERRGTAWGGGVGFNMLLHTPHYGFTADGLLGFNRPELLQIVPAAQNTLEWRFSLGVRVEN
jgi:hypothetical protein